MIQYEQLASEVSFRTSRSSGPGGQNVNKVESKVTLLWDIEASRLFTDLQKQMLKDALAKRTNALGVVSVDVSESRSQLENKQIAIQKLKALVLNALLPVKNRIPTKISKAKILARLDRKKIHAAKKSNRRWRME